MEKKKKKKKKRGGGGGRRLIEADDFELGTKRQRQGQNNRDAQVRSVNVSTRGCTHRCAHTWAGRHTKRGEKRYLLPESDQSLNQSNTKRPTGATLVQFNNI